MPFTPPFYGKLGKSYGDLFKKGFDTNNKLSIVSKTPEGLTLTLEGTVGKNDIQGKQKVEYSDKKWGKADAEIDTTSGKVWGTATSNKGKLIPSTEVSVAGGFDPSSKDPLVKAVGAVKLEAQYSKDFLSATGRVFVGYLTKKDKSVDENASIRLEADAVMGFDNLSVGAAISNTIGDQADDLNVNVGCEYSTNNFTASLQTEKFADVLKFSWYHKISGDFQLGAEMVSDEFGRLSADRRRTLNVASKYQLNTDTSVCLRGNNYGEIAAGIEQSLKDPRIKVSAAATFSAKGMSSFTADKFGLGLTFGDF
eukprot:gb/GEZN01009053.1/.p1 GENE.gb/GEZN01009053.1/~~gb/GEZN01009053.1/.p1  ORF type:complete len:310 (+),score=64.14 gb/GEZN01009053.1/:33-962(+)